MKLEEMQKLVRQLHGLLSDPEEGMMSWQQAVHESMFELCSGWMEDRKMCAAFYDGANVRGSGGFIGLFSSKAHAEVVIAQLLADCGADRHVVYREVKLDDTTFIHENFEVGDDAEPIEVEPETITIEEDVPEVSKPLAPEEDRPWLSKREKLDLEERNIKIIALEAEMNSMPSGTAKALKRIELDRMKLNRDSFLHERELNHQDRWIGVIVGVIFGVIMLGAACVAAWQILHPSIFSEPRKESYETTSVPLDAVVGEKEDSRTGSPNSEDDGAE